jgi:hypothetical protein
MGHFHREFPHTIGPRGGKVKPNWPKARGERTSEPTGSGGEDAAEHIEDALQPGSRGIGRPSKTEPFRLMVSEILTEQPELLAVEVTRRIRERGYTGGKPAFSTVSINEKRRSQW